jgi:hypothetical protein
MSNIHNNSVLQSATSRSGLKAGEAQNESNGLGSSGYFAIFEEESQGNEDQYIDRSDQLTTALVGLATLNSSRLFVQKGVLKKLASKSATKFMSTKIA